MYMSFILEVFNIIFWFIVILIPLVVIHEFGHLIMARLCGVKVVEFGVGIPPRIAFKKWRGIVWSLNYIMLGGFAKIYGDHDALDEAHEQSKINPELAKKQYLENRLYEVVQNKELQFFLEENSLVYDKDWQEFDNSRFLTSDEKNYSQKNTDTYLRQQKTLETLIAWEYDNKLSSKEAFYNKNLFQKTLILMGGILFNLVTAVIIFTIFYAFTGTPQSFVPVGTEVNKDISITRSTDNLQVLKIAPNGAGYAAGIRSGDYLLNFAGKNTSEIKSFKDFTDIIDNSREKQVPVEYIEKSTGAKKTTILSLAKEGDTSKFGVKNNELGYFSTLKANSFGSAVLISTSYTKDILTENFMALGRLVKAPFNGDKAAIDQVGGPIQVGELGNDIYDLQGVKGIFNAMAFISISLAAFNILPIPALDGGRFIIILLSTIAGRRNKKLEGVVISSTMIFLLVLAVVIAIKDINGISLGSSQL
jgi:regulator of sigma E protease